MLDMGVSLLEAIGVKLSQGSMALGRSVFNLTTETLVEQYGIEQLTDKLNGHSEFYNNLFLHDKVVAPSGSPWQ